MVSKGKKYSEQNIANPLIVRYQQFGVPPSVVVAILSVETRLGTWTGKHQAVSVLSTTAIGKDPRLHDKVYDFVPRQPPSKAEFDEKMVPRLVRRADWGYRELKALLGIYSAL